MNHKITEQNMGHVLSKKKKNMGHVSNLSISKSNHNYFFCSTLMASTATPSPQILLFNPILGNTKTIRRIRFFRIATTTNSHISFQVHASAKDSQGPQKAPFGVDTRIHWENDDEGWIGGSTKQQQNNEEEKPKKKLLGEDFADLLNFQGSHYE